MKTTAKLDRNQVSIEEARYRLSNCVLFRGLQPHERHQLLARTQTRIFADRESIFQKGAPGDTLMALLRGNVRISITSSEGKEIIFATLEPGDIFGEVAVLDGKSRSADATAVGECALAILERRDLLAFLAKHPNAWLSLVEILCDRLRHTDEVLAEIALLQIPTRLAKAILRAAKAIPNATTLVKDATLRIQLTQGELANLVGARRESVNKCLRGWQRAGILRVEEGSIAIYDETSLTRIADLDQS